jgi:hypothetical protein
MKKDISNRKERCFIITEVVAIHWEHHIPLIVDFWGSILLYNPV